MGKRSRHGKSSHIKLPSSTSYSVPNVTSQPVVIDEASSAGPPRDTDSGRPDLSNVSVYIDSVCAPPEVAETFPGMSSTIEHMYDGIARGFTGSFQPTTYEEAFNSFGGEQARLPETRPNINHWVAVMFLQFEGGEEKAHLRFHSTKRLIEVSRGACIVLRAIEVDPEFFANGAYSKATDKSGMELIGASGRIKAKALMTYWLNVSSDQVTFKE